MFVVIEDHAINRTRRFPANHLLAVMEVLACLGGERFTGEVRVCMSEGGFNGVAVEESVKLIPSQTS